MFLKIKFNKYDLRDIGRKGLIQQIENMFHVQQARRSFQKILSTLLGHTDSFIKFRTIAIIEILFCGCYAIKYRFKGKHTKNNNSSKYAIDLQLAPHSLSALFIHLWAPGISRLGLTPSWSTPPPSPLGTPGASHVISLHPHFYIIRYQPPLKLS